MVTEVTDSTLVGSAIQAGFVYAHEHTLDLSRPYPTRVHGPTGQTEYWLTFYRIWRCAVEAGHGHVSLSAIVVRLGASRVDRLRVDGVQYEENRLGIQGAWG